VIPVVFGSSARQLTGIYHAPGSDAALGAGVVLCNPLGYEAMCAHRTYRHLARRLAAAGFDVLRFDYHGTGDSSGRGDEPDRLRAWLDSVHAAVDELRQLAGVTSIDLFGVRLGGTVAALAARERGDIRGLVLWAPVVSGRSYVREARALRMLGHGNGQPAPVSNNAGDPCAPSLRELSGLSLLALRGRLAERALVLTRDDITAGQERLALHLRDCGVEAELRTGPGYAPMMDHPESTAVPFATLDSIIAWLRPASVEARRPLDRVPSSVLTDWSQAPGRAVREEAMSFGEGHRLFGILTEGEGRRDRRTAVVFLNAGANHRVGPNRLYVSLARDLAACGHLAFRFDAGGLGDGEPAPGLAENRVYSKDSVADVKAAMTLLTSIRAVERFILIGICSGGFLAFHTSTEDLRVAGQIMINPQTFHWRQGDSLALSPRRGFKSTRYYLQALSRPLVWIHALRGQLDLGGVVRELSRRSIARSTGLLRGILARARRLPAPCGEVERVFRQVSDRGVRSLLIFSSDDGGLDMIEEHLGSGGRTMQGQPNFRLEIVEGADHTFTQKEAQDRLRALVTRFVVGETRSTEDERKSGSPQPCRGPGVTPTRFGTPA
jgi:pimeloyl-ACP methyl ester carboxylesterase